MAKAKKSRVFLGGTCAETSWRGELIKQLKNIDYFNPVVEDWTEADFERELKERETCDYILYFLTPKMSGFYSIAEVVDDSHKRPEKTIFGFIIEDDGEKFTADQLKSMKALVKMLTKNGVKCLHSIKAVADHLNKKEA